MKSSNVLKTKILMLIIAGAFMAACGASKTSLDKGRSSSSRDIPGTLNDNGEVIDTSTGTVVGFFATCNRFASNALDGVITSYFDSFTGSFVPDVIRMELKAVPAELKTNENIYIQVFRWQEDNPGQPVTNPQPVSMYFQLENGTWLNQTGITSLSKVQIEGMISSNSLSNQNITIDNFLDKVLIVLTGMDIEYDAVMINTYDDEAGAQAQDSVNVLIPAFAADPNIYASTHEAASLRMLHPNYQLKDNGMVEYDYYLETQDLCL